MKLLISPTSIKVEVRPLAARTSVFHQPEKIWVSTSVMLRDIFPQNMRIFRVQFKDYIACSLAL